MPDETLSPAVKQLLSRHIGSVEQLEVLLLLRGSPERAWTSAEVYDVIRSSPVSVSQRRRGVHRRGISDEGGRSAGPLSLRSQSQPALRGG